MVSRPTFTAVSASISTPVRPTDETAFLPGAPTLQLPAVNPDDDDVAGAIEPALGLVQTPAAAESVEPAPGLSKGARRAIVAGVSVSALAVLVLGLVAVLVKGGGGGGGGIAQAVLTASGDAPSEVQILVDGEEVARALPAAIPLSPDAPHVVRVTAAGREPFEMSLPPLGEGAMQPITVALRPAAGGDVVAASESPKKGDAASAKPGAADANVDDTKGDDAKADDAKVDDAKKPDDAKADDGKADDAKVDDAKKPDDAKADDAPAEPALSTSDGAAWRLSFATIAKEERRSVRGAEVLQDGVIIGRTPFERDFPVEVSKVVLRIKADGFVAKDVEFARGDERTIGPATVALTSVAALDGEGERAAVASDDKGGEAAAGDDPKNADGKQTDDGQRVASARADSEKSDTRAGDAQTADGQGARSDDAPDGKGSGKSASAARSDDKKSDDRTSDDKKADDKKADARKSDDKKSDDKKSEPRRESKRSDDRDDKKSDDKKADKHDKAVTLAIGTRPPAEIFIDKKPHGMAPLMGPKAPSVSLGKHFVMLKEPKSGKKVMLEVTITKPDAKAKIIYRFDDDVVDASGVTVKKK